MSTLTGTIDELLTPRLLGSLAARSGIPDTKVKTGISAAIASILDGLAGKATDSRAMGQVSELIQRTPDVVDADSLLDERGSLHRSGEQLLGVATPGTSLTARMANFLGVGMSSATGLVAAAAGLAMTAFRRFANDRGGLDAQSLSTMLIGEKQAIHAAVPAGLSPVVTDVSPISRRSQRTHVPVERRRSRAWIWLLAIPLVLLAIWGINRMMRRRERVQPAVTPSERAPVKEPAVTPIEPKRDMLPEPRAAEPPAVPPAVTPPAAEPSTPPVVEPSTPPSAAALSFPAGSAEAAFLAHVKSPTGTDESMWFELDKVEYDTGAATLRPGATEQLAHVADILKANPTVRVKVGGSTDATGAADANAKLFETRADAVKQALVAAGVSADRIETASYDELQKRDETAGAAPTNRRVAIRVISR